MDSRRCAIAVYKETGDAETLSDSGPVTSSATGVSVSIPEGGYGPLATANFAAANQEDVGALDNCTIAHCRYCLPAELTQEKAGLRGAGLSNVVRLPSRRIGGLGLVGAGDEINAVLR